jgi:hypothetical protein
VQIVGFRRVDFGNGVAAVEFDQRVKGCWDLSKGNGTVELRFGALANMQIEGWKLQRIFLRLGVEGTPQRPGSWQTAEQTLKLILNWEGCKSLY